MLVCFVLQKWQRRRSEKKTRKDWRFDRRLITVKEDDERLNNDSLISGEHTHSLSFCKRILFRDKSHFEAKNMQRIVSLLLCLWILLLVLEVFLSLLLHEPSVLSCNFRQDCLLVFLLEVNVEQPLFSLSCRRLHFVTTNPYLLFAFLLNSLLSHEGSKVIYFVLL